MNSLGLVFPGQGSQSVGMLADIAKEFPEVESTFAEASEIVGFDLWKLTQQGPTDELDKTVNTQPALLTAAYSVWKILKNNTGIKPDLLAGHSLGEYTALVCAGVFSFADGVRLVAARGKYMQDAVPVGQGALAAILGLDDDVVKKICDEAAQGAVLAPANYNTPGQVVIAGEAKAVARAVTAATEAGAKMAKTLAVSVPSHCVLMKPAAERLANLLDTLTINKPLIPVVNNVNVEIYETAAQIKDGLTKQLYMPVRWVETIELFANKGIKEVIECGPGKVLTGLNKRITTTMQYAFTSELASLQKILQSVSVSQG